MAKTTIVFSNSPRSRRYYWLWNADDNPETQIDQIRDAQFPIFTDLISEVLDCILFESGRKQFDCQGKKGRLKREVIQAFDPTRASDSYFERLLRSPL